MMPLPQSHNPTKRLDSRHRVVPPYWGIQMRLMPCLRAGESNEETDMVIDKRILVIDDEERMADSIKALLSNFDYDVEVAYSGSKGVQMMASGDYQVVITDIRMPDMDGYEVMRHIQEKKPHILVVVITGHASTESVIEALHNRAFDYLQKPFDFEKLKDCVDRAFMKIETDRIREDMISMITHDLKIPLSSIIGFSAMIFDKDGNLHPRAVEFVRMIRLNGQKIETLIDNFLTTCKIDSGKLQIFRQELNLQYVVEDLLAIMAMDVERQGQHLETNFTSGDPFLMGDEHLLSRAIGNIINNAIKYTPQGGTIQVEIRHLTDSQSPLRKPSVQLRVSNTGPGIPHHLLDSIFDKYKRTGNITGIEGSGIGLYVVKFIIEQHDGHVSVESVPDELTTFALTLPLHYTR